MSTTKISDLIKVNDRPQAFKQWLQQAITNHQTKHFLALDDVKVELVNLTWVEVVKIISEFYRSSLFGKNEWNPEEWFFERDRLEYGLRLLGDLMLQEPSPALITHQLRAFRERLDSIDLEVLSEASFLNRLKNCKSFVRGEFDLDSFWWQDILKREVVSPLDLNPPMWDHLKYKAEFSLLSPKEEELLGRLCTQNESMRCYFKETPIKKNFLFSEIDTVRVAAADNDSEDLLDIYESSLNSERSHEILKIEDPHVKVVLFNHGGELYALLEHDEGHHCELSLHHNGEKVDFVKENRTGLANLLGYGQFSFEKESILNYDLKVDGVPTKSHQCHL